MKRAVNNRRVYSYANIEKKIEQANLAIEYSVAAPKFGIVPK